MSSHIPALRLFGFLILFLSLFWTAAPVAASDDCTIFPETGYQICGRIRAYWQQNGGLEVFGYPISAETTDQSQGQNISTQWFERNRLELHPENAAPYDVLLGRLGVEDLTYKGYDWQTLSLADSTTLHYFATTGHAIAPQFWEYWATHGLKLDGNAKVSEAESLALFGLPISEAQVETNSSGDTVLTQWFERARFEYHPEQGEGSAGVQLGRIGADLAGQFSIQATEQILPERAARVLELVNQERVNAGCPALVINATLTEVALEHSQDMASNDYFSHTGLDGRSPFQRMSDAGYQWRRAAENLVAGAKSPEEAVQLWMNSEGHRENILNCALRETGVAVVDDPGDPLGYLIYWSQTFGTR